MDKNYPKNKDPRPKRRRDKNNPYEIFTVGIKTDSPHYYISFTDSQGVHICMEINKSLFELFDRFELEDLSYLNELERHHVYPHTSEIELASRNITLDKFTDNIVQLDNLHSAIRKLPYVQRKRLMLYYFNDYNLEEIAKFEGCSIQAVSKSITAAKNKLIKLLKEG